MSAESNIPPATPPDVSTPDRPDGKKPRQKRFHRKVATGCRTCRKRRVKCGEERPNCLRCTAIGRICDGYENIRIAQTDLTPTGLWKPKFVTLAFPSPSGLVPTQEEQALFDNFRLQVLDHLCGPFDSQAWQQAVLALALENTATWNAAVALSSLFSSQSQGSSDKVNPRKTALTYYNKAIKALQYQMDELEGLMPNTVLVTCLLFVAFEFQESGYIQARSHLEGALNLVAEVRRGSRAFPPSWTREGTMISSLVEAFKRLDVQMSLFTSSRICLSQDLKEEAAQGPPGAIDFDDIANASRELTIQLASMRELLFEIAQLHRDHLVSFPPEIYSRLANEVMRQLVFLKRWDDAMALLLPCLKTRKDANVSKVLRMHQISCKVLVSTCLNGGREILFDSFNGDFERLLTLADDLLATSGTKSPCLTGSEVVSYDPGFSLDMGIIPPVYLTALKCREPTLRRRALNVLQRCKQREGAWDGPSAAIMAEGVIKLEERNSSGERPIKEESRLHQAWYDLSHSGTRTIHCKRRLFESDGSWIEYYEMVS